MKHIFWALFIAITILRSASFANENDVFFEARIYKRQQSLKRFVDIKAALLNGDVSLAKIMLEAIDGEEKHIMALKGRFWALIDFIEGRYEDSLSRVTGPLFKNPAPYRNTCLLKVLNYLALKQTLSMIREYTNCELFNLEFSKGQLIWLDTLVNLANHNPLTLKGAIVSSIAPFRSSVDLTKTWIKLGLLLNKEKLILSQIGDIPGEYFKSAGLRELIALVYYRTGDLVKAKSFIEDLPSANAENIKGNIMLSQKKYEIAFGHFYLAMQRKANSTNALERGIPLAWKLGKWQQGHEMATKIRGIRSKDQKRNRSRIALKTAFLTKMGHHYLAYKELVKLRKLFKGLLPRELEQLEAYNAIMLNDQSRADTFAHMACKKFDAIFCWVQLQKLTWPGLEMALKRDDKTASSKAFLVNELKKATALVPLKDELLVDQVDIEELDDQVLQNNRK